MEIQPWGIEIPCHSEPYTGKKLELNVEKEKYAATQSILTIY